MRKKNQDKPRHLRAFLIQLQRYSSATAEVSADSFMVDSTGLHFYVKGPDEASRKVAYWAPGEFVSVVEAPSSGR